VTAALRPAFISVASRVGAKEWQSTVAFAADIQSTCGVDVLLHVTCHLTPAVLRALLEDAKAKGIRNLFACRGDAPHASSSVAWRPPPGGFEHAVDLVRLIRKEHGDYFCIAVAAYPEVHLECYNNPRLPPSNQARARDMAHLVDKVAAGADFVIAQFVYDPNLFLSFAEAARTAGVLVPIVPAYMPIQVRSRAPQHVCACVRVCARVCTCVGMLCVAALCASLRGCGLQTYDSFQKVTSWCRTRVPPRVTADLARVREDDAQVKAYGVTLGAATLDAWFTAGCKSVHLHTMNMFLSVAHILVAARVRSPVCLTELSLAHGGVGTSDALRGTASATGAGSASALVGDWTEFPNGRFSAVSSPAYGELTDYYLSSKRPKVDRRALWGVPSSIADIKRVFIMFLDGVISALPWYEATPAQETLSIYESLRWMNQCGFLTINSQPRVNGAPSSDPRFGWGGVDGVVYQKAYVEFFVAPHQFRLLLQALPRYPTLSYHALNAAGEEYVNVAVDKANAVTWGVFPGREIIQPTVVDPKSFRIWKDEAFDIWKTQWQSVYNEDTVRTALRAACVRARAWLRAHLRTLRCAWGHALCCRRRSAPRGACCKRCTTRTSWSSLWTTTTCPSPA
ncbi:hypothetical protein EON67_01760, partial [archaeon]